MNTTRCKSIIRIHDRMNKIVHTSKPMSQTGYTFIKTVPVLKEEELSNYDMEKMRTLINSYDIAQVVRLDVNKCITTRYWCWGNQIRMEVVPKSHFYEYSDFCQDYMYIHLKLLFFEKDVETRVPKMWFLPLRLHQNQSQKI